MKFIYNYKVLIVLLFTFLSCKLYKKDFDNPVDYIANDDLGVDAPALVFYPKTQTLNQNEVVKISSEIDVRHQIIITTSMISPELDNSDLCVGEFYSESNPTLKIG